VKFIPAVTDLSEILQCCTNTTEHVMELFHYQVIMLS